MKYSETPEVQRRGRSNYIDSRWGGLVEFLRRSEERVLNYVFILNGSSLVAALIYIATKSSNSFICASIVCSGIGVLAILIHATWGYYRAESIFRAYRADVRDYFGDKLDWEVLTDRDEARSVGALIGHGLGWLAGCSFVAALVFGILGGI